MSNDIVNYPRQGAQQPGSTFSTSARGVDTSPQALPGEGRGVAIVADVAVPNCNPNPHP